MGSSERRMNARLDRLSLELAYVQMMVETPLLKQLPVRPLFDNLPIVDDQHVVCVADGAQTVSNDETGSSLHQAKQRFLNAGLGPGIHAAGGLIRIRMTGSASTARAMERTCRCPWLKLLARSDSTV